MQLQRKTDNYLVLIRILSMDVVAAVIANGIFFSTLFKASLPWYFWVLLPLSVWIVYATDHLLDGFKNPKDKNLGTYIFHQRHFSKILFILILFSLLGFGIGFYHLTRQEFIIACIFIMGVMAYLYLQHFNRRYAYKEWIIAWIYSLSVMLWPYLYKTSYSLQAVLLSFMFYLLVQINVLFFSWMDRKEDKQNNKATYITIFKENAFIKVMAMLMLMFVVSAIAYLYYDVKSGFANWRHFLILSIIFGLYMMYFLLRKKISPLYLAMLMDGAFIISGILLFL